MTPPRRILVLAAGIVWAGTATAACFTVFDAADRVVYQSTAPPVDISRPISQAVAAVYPRNYHLLMADDSYCPGIDEAPTVYAVPLPGARTVVGGSPALALADGFKGSHLREEAMPRSAGPITGMFEPGPSATADVATPPKPRRRSPLRRR